MTDSAQTLEAIKRAISTERLDRYQTATGGDHAAAIALYEQNIALSEAVFGLLHGLEVAVRNRMHEVLSAHFRTQMWFFAPGVPLSEYARDKANEARRGAGGTAAPPGKIVAELNFGFWCNLTARSYHWSLWQPCLHKAFPQRRLSRTYIHGRLETIRKLRNRIAHHERVLTGQGALYASSGSLLHLDEIIECAEWIDAALNAWLTSRFRCREAASILSELANKGITL
jgi:hypothetical protein